jgi:hypothetical protein
VAERGRPRERGVVERIGWRYAIILMDADGRYRAARRRVTKPADLVVFS